jgi:hypothetical protein
MRKKPKIERVKEKRMEKIKEWRKKNKIKEQEK